MVFRGSGVVAVDLERFRDGVVRVEWCCVGFIWSRGGRAARRTRHAVLF